jgi:predicted kinase
MRENTLAVGASGSGQSVIARNKTQLERRLNLERLARSYASISPKDYLERAIDIMADEL